MKKKRNEHIQQTKDNPLTRWKVQEYENVIPQESYLNQMHQFINKDKRLESDRLHRARACF